MNRPSPTPSSHRALVLDDDGFQRELLKGLLGQLGWSDVTCCESGHQAQATVQQSGVNGYALMLVDLHMPGMDGFQFMQALESSGFRGAVIIVSGQSSEVLHSAELVAQLRRFQLLGTLRKPVQKQDLRGLLSRL